MISIVVLYSTDRLMQLENTIACLEDVDGYHQCQKILAVDGQTNVRPDGWKVIEIARPGQYYCWATALNSAVKECDNEIVWYLDSDRVVPTDYIQIISEKTKDNVFVYPERMYSIKEDVSVELLREIRDNIFDHKDMLLADHRTNNPLQLNQKNVFSGCVSFTKNTFEKLGGFDEKFQGWGFPDYDLLMNATRNGCEFVGVNCSELHQHHKYGGTDVDVALMNVWNCRQYLEKWNIRPSERMLRHYKVTNVLKYQSMKEFIEAERERAEERVSRNKGKHFMATDTEKAIHILKNVIKEAEKAIIRLRTEEDLASEMPPVESPEPVEKVAEVPEEKPKVEKSTQAETIDGPVESDFESLKSLALTDEWPTAVPEKLIADPDSEEDKLERGENIYQIHISEYLKSPQMKVLDFGCGEGHMVKKANDFKTNGSKFIGYDIQKQGDLKWDDESDGYLLTTDFEKVKSQGPYDLIILYDVLDHIVGEDPEETMKKVHSLLSYEGTVFVKCHPWCSRHGGHCYREFNKAFAHLVFNNEELKLLGVKNLDAIPSQLTTHPLSQYTYWFEQGGFEIKTRQADLQMPENFFSDNELVSKRLKRRWALSPNVALRNGRAMPVHQMKQSFLDFVLKAK